MTGAGIENELTSSVPLALPVLVISRELMALAEPVVHTLLIFIDRQTSSSPLEESAATERKASQQYVCRVEGPAELHRIHELNTLTGLTSQTRNDCFYDSNSHSGHLLQL